MASYKSYSDPFSGQDYRWDDGKNKWVKSHGRSSPVLDQANQLVKGKNQKKSAQLDRARRSESQWKDIAEKGEYVQKAKRNKRGRITSEAPTKAIPQQAGPYSPLQMQVNNLNWMMENIQMSDQHLTTLQEASLLLQNRMTLGIDDVQTQKNQEDRRQKDATKFFNKPGENEDFSNVAPSDGKTGEKPEEIERIITGKAKVSDGKEGDGDGDPTAGWYKDMTEDPDYSPETTKANQLKQQSERRQQRIDRRKQSLEAKKLEGFPAKRFHANLEKNPRTDINKLFHKARKG